MDIMRSRKWGAPPGRGWQDMCDKSLSDGYFDVLILTALLSGSRIAISLETLSISLGTHFRIPGGRSPHVGCSSIVAWTLSSESIFCGHIRGTEQAAHCSIRWFIDLLIADLMGVLHLLIKNMCSEALTRSHRWCSTNAGTSWCLLLEGWDCDFSSVAPQCTVQRWCRAGTWKIFGEWLMCDWKNCSWVLMQNLLKGAFCFTFPKLSVDQQKWT